MNQNPEDNTKMQEVMEMMDGPKTFKNPDSYKIMEYKCQDCGISEFIWNSRDNVSPFSVGCRKDDCGGSMYHVNMQLDQVRPDFKPAPGMRYFADMTRKRGEMFVKKRIESAKGTPYEVKENTPEYEELYYSLLNDFITGDCSMDLLIAGEDDGDQDND